MKGTLAILGLLVAAYAAPLFANEVPLILEETIQLPGGTRNWDVAPTWVGEYWWISHVALNDTSSRLLWGVSTNETLDSLDRAGRPYGHLALFFDGETRPICLACTRTDVPAVPWIPYSGYSIVQGAVLNLYDSPVERASWFSRSQISVYISGESQSYVEIGALALTSARLFPAPPDLTNHWQGLLARGESRSWTNGSSSWIENSSFGAVFDGSVDSSDFSLPYGQNSYLVSTDWADFHYVAVYGYSNRDPAGPYSTSTGVFSVDEDNTFVEFARITETTPNATMSPIGITSYPGSGSALIAFEAGDEVVGWANEIGQIWERTEPYAKLLTGYVLIGEGTEQFLGLDSTNRRLDVIIAETGQIWGQTSLLDSGYAEMKIIGRYHNETRRLVVRYGSELRIYRFGEPIYTDANDTRPELPQALALSAYPNPFNPTTMIAFDLPRAARASLSVYDLNGRLVQTLFDEPRTAGHGEIAFNGANLPSGIYFARFVAGDFAWTQKLVLLK